MKIPGQITIITSRQPDDGKVHIELRDPGACIRFLDLSIGRAKFVEVLGGMGFCGCELDVRWLEKVGKIRESQPLEFAITTRDLGDKRQEQAIAEAISRCPDGWTPDTSFNSQGSFFTRNGKSWARTTMHRWVDRIED